MDTLTHALSGALLARATAPQPEQTGALALRTRLWVGAAAAALPDSDYLLNFIDPLLYLNGHRGITHSLLLWPFWSLLLAWLFSFAGRRRHDWRCYAGVCAQGIGVHIAGDVITSYGTQLLAPFSSLAVALPYTFIIDPCFTTLLLVGLCGAWYWHSRKPARIALLLLALYISTEAGLHYLAHGIARQHIVQEHLTGATAQALPQPFAPFRWKLVIEQGERYQEAYVNLLARAVPVAAAPDAGLWARLRALYRPPQQLEWQERYRFGDAQQAVLARTAWLQPGFAGYRHFATLPALYRIDRRDEARCVWFIDLRFTIDALTPPFRYGMCQTSGTAPWALRRLARDYLRYD